MSDPVSLLQELIRCPSVTPHDAGAQDILKARLQKIGFEIFDLPFGEGEHRILNFFARLGSGHPHFCFAGHTDVVPAGKNNWDSDPFSAELKDGVIYGRGACDMKGGIAAFISAVENFLEGHSEFSGSLSFLITGDEEGPGINGTVKVLEWMQKHNHIPDFCLVGEPTSAQVLGDIIKIGRRGSLNAVIEVEGTQGHVAYPHLADNPIHKLMTILTSLTQPVLDNGNEWFQPSSVQVTSIDVGNVVTNLIPGTATARINIRFNNLHSGTALKGWIATQCHRVAEYCKIDVAISGEAFLTEPGEEVRALCEAIHQVNQVKPRLDTGGGTSDARFISQYCAVAEFGLVGQTMHKVNEEVSILDLNQLTTIYQNVIEALFKE
ncbi:succinyl-diaminopimelate desuccinylase [Commensalibacter papalotli (ex Botero et al. 2024)]|uniref:Succinyl-diaminopimelate desuccinylase n=1 Tax=Commensalibacter papalotli (ex Botero et al. 2024) TaxID=2972766 RepID=A0ABM9HJ97_9PROT|nr:succinyl-diaminopimelate desuccinylase [Commensalibacter papalotli (ex Botero et al. 2024)]CAI3925079.1 Acetylornithine deacetylase/Succinyl-diaminopimelate desuccinylase or related deacylase (ArgE) (PDB:1CG2) [Commensalibacter papalotli (ex Botero et al. 2024)]CAI3926975.1 Acetylornithine deacetylase/Succinyl-diaminopimelate desuccinylase or related deacylase (ArgE) (PDB:1CG2) [Commensalibacter papalotli (ex Botero et al. 2024)]